MHTQPQYSLAPWHIAYLLGIAAALLASTFGPSDTATWWMEVLPVLIAIPILGFTYQKFHLTELVYFFIFIHCLILILGGTYTYAKVPAGFWVQEMFDLSRNPYDKLGHFAQGFIPALIAREILIRKHIVNGKRMLNFIVVCIVLAISATYELIEWIAALIMNEGAESFLGTQGDEWDTQSDMAWALLGAIIAIVFFGKWHDQQINKLKH
jgi:putative membrane protein